MTERLVLAKVRLTDGAELTVHGLDGSRHPRGVDLSSKYANATTPSDAIETVWDAIDTRLTLFVRGRGRGAANPIWTAPNAAQVLAVTCDPYD